MTETIIAASAGILRTIVGGLITYFTQKAQFKNEILRTRSPQLPDFVPYISQPQNKINTWPN
jgi:hypothetical protein